MNIPSRNKALSLIELIAVMAITAIIAGGVLLAFSAVGNKKLETTARTLAAELALARQRAASEHDDFTVAFDTTAEKYTVSNDTIQLKEISLDVDLASVTDCAGTAQTQLIFQSHTGIADTTCITLTSGARSRYINITGDTGYIAVQ